MYYLLSSEQGPRLCLGEVFGTVIVFFSPTCIARDSGNSNPKITDANQP
jgi:hypothetical protein